MKGARTIANVEKCGYVIKDTGGEPDAIIIETGSQALLALEVAEQSEKKVRVVSMPSSTEFDKQSDRV